MNTEGTARRQHGTNQPDPHFSIYIHSSSATCKHFVRLTLIACTIITVYHHYGHEHLFPPRRNEHLCFRHSLLGHHKDVLQTRAFAEKTTPHQAQEKVVQSMVQYNNSSNRQLLSSHQRDDLRCVCSSPLVIRNDLPYAR